MLKRRVPTILLSSVLSFTMASQAVFAQNVDLASQIQNATTSRDILKVGSALFETSDIAQFYRLRNYAPVWTSNGVATEFATELRQTIQVLSAKHGLIASDYWTSELENYFTGLNQNNAIAFELAATRAFLLLGMHLSDGRIDPTFIDNDVRFKKREFIDHHVMAQAVSAAPNMMIGIVESLAPQHSLYKDALSVLAKLKEINLAGGYKSITAPRVDIKLGEKHPVVPALRARLIHLGYPAYGGVDTTYDAALSNAVNEMQKEYGFEITKDLLKRKSFIWAVLKGSSDENIKQAEATLEKLRWLPKQLEPNMILVNTNATDVRVFENNQLINQFKSINGKGLRRTPMMKTWITRVIINPHWTATDSIILQDKLPEIIKDPTYLNRIRMRVVNRQTNQTVDPTTLDWANDGRRIARENKFIMDPGPKNALGVYKFPMMPDPSKPDVGNSDAIFMHYTDSPEKFEGTNSRLLSSGCIRLEKADWFAAYLLKNVPGYDADTIKSMTAKGIEGEVFVTDKTVILPQSDYRAVYTVPLTVEKTASGKIRIMVDNYMHDSRIWAAVMSKDVRTQVNQSINVVQTGTPTGQLKVTGVAGLRQQFAQVVAVRCGTPEFSFHLNSKEPVMKRNCDQQVKFSLNTAQTLSEGQYIVGFENSLYPGFVNVKSGQTTTIQLQRIDIPKSFARESSVKVYRDFTSQIEQKKVFFEKFYYGKNLFRQTVRKFGDFYLAGINDIDLAAPASYNFCSEKVIKDLVPARDVREQAKFVCESYNHAKTMMDYADLYRFDNRGGYQEAVVDYPGDVIPKKMLRHLVATPTRAGEFVSVMPGAYRIVSGSGSPAKTEVTAELVESYGDLTRTFLNSAKDEKALDDADLDPTAAAIVNDAGVVVNPITTPEGARCSQAVVWRTEKRSYCTGADADGCNPATSRMCEEMKLDLRFRK